MLMILEIDMTSKVLKDSSGLLIDWERCAALVGVASAIWHILKLVFS